MIRFLYLVSLVLLMLGLGIGLQRDAALGSNILIGGIIVVAINYWWHTRGKHEN